MKIECIRVGMLRTNCYLVYDEEKKEVLVVDPGDNGDGLSSYMEEEGLKPVAILLTHGHMDHIHGVPYIKEKYDIPVYVHELDEAMLNDGNMNLGRFSIFLDEKDFRLKGGESLDIGGLTFKVIHTPGHTQGGVCYYFENENVLFAGDTMFRNSWGRTDFPGGSERALMESIREKLLPLPENTSVYPGHEGATVIRDERRVHGYRE